MADLGFLGGRNAEIGHLRHALPRPGARMRLLPR